jgi:hypothetical protein
MTAEIAVMNKSGIALAADSAVTISFNKDGRRFQKIFSTNKLFMLSKYYPVGIMIFGNASLVGIPWEILIKEFRKKELAANSFPTLNEYGESFIKYLNGNTFYFTEALEFESVYRIFKKQTESIEETYFEKIFGLLEDVKPVDVPKLSGFFQAVFDKAIDDKYNALEGLENIKTFKITEKRFNQKYGKWIEIMIDNFQSNPPEGATVEAEQRNKLKKIAYLAVVKNTFKINDASGVVIAGFGENEIYPSLITYDIEAIIDNKLKFLVARDLAVTHQENSFVEPFAQDDMVQTFMRGVSPSYEDIVDEFIQRVLEEYPDKVSEKISKIVTDKQREDVAKQLKEVGVDYLKTFRKRMTDWVTNNNDTPVKRSVAILPIEELASMASALVNLTSFKRRVTPVSETVGGAVDVAVITKGDGFIWIERKHYFEAGKNPHFFANNYAGENNYEEWQTKNGKNKQSGTTKH